MNIKNARKILVLGSSGSGKSTLTRHIAKTNNLPPIHLDVHFWRPSWTEPPIEVWREEVKELSKNEAWVMDGTFSESFDIRFPKADKIIIIKLPRLTCLIRAIKRFFKYSKKIRRPDMAPGCDEGIDLSFYKYIWTYNKKVLPKIYEAIEEFDCEKKVLTLNSDKEIKLFLQSL